MAENRENQYSGQLPGNAAASEKTDGKTGSPENSVGEAGNSEKPTGGMPEKQFPGTDITGCLQRDSAWLD